MLIVNLTIFWAMQIFASVAFKYGSQGEAGRSKRWLMGFAGGNLVGASSIWFLIKIFAAMPHNCNVALMIANAGGFIGSQVLLALLYRSRLAPAQWAGIALVTVGTAIASL